MGQTWYIGVSTEAAAVAEVAQKRGTIPVLPLHCHPALPDPNQPTCHLSCTDCLESLSHVEKTRLKFFRVKTRLTSGVKEDVWEST